MTLVVSRLFSDGPRLVCDSELTPADGGKQNPYDQGALKAVILHRGLCVAFDGGELTGREAILDAGRAATTGFDLAEIRGRLKQASRRSSNGFIVAALSPGSCLVRIRDGNDEGEVAGCSLGSRSAFSAFQGHFHSADPIQQSLQLVQHPRLNAVELAAAGRMQSSLAQVLDEGFAGVGGLPIGVSPTEGGFRYQSMAMLAADHEQVIDAKDGWVDADWGTAAEGGFGYAIKTPDIPGVGAIGAYFPHGRLGVLYYPGRFLGGIPFQDVSDGDFCSAIEARFGFPFGRKGMGFGSSGGSDSLQVTI